MIDRDAIIADAVNGETNKAIARRGQRRAWDPGRTRIRSADSVQSRARTVDRVAAVGRIASNLS
jgi:hypothetical protein